MSDTNTQTTNPATTEAPEEQLQKIDKGTYILEQVKFRPKTALEGLEYYVLQFKSETNEQARQSLLTLIGDGTEENKGKWTAQQVIGVVNSAIRSAQRVKAQNVIMSFEGDDLKKQYHQRLLKDPCLLKPEEAEAWVPGERELSVQGLAREMAEYMKKGMKAEAAEVLKKIQAKMAEEMAELAQEA